MRIVKGSTEPMRVKVYVINEGTSSQYYGLKNADENTVLTAAPNNWKSKRGAENWAKKHGYTVVKSSKSIRCSFSDSDNITIFYNGFEAYSGSADDTFGTIYRLLFKDKEATEACADYLDSIGYSVNANAREVSMTLSKLIQSYVSDHGNDLDDVIYWDHGSIEFAPYTTSIRSSRSIQGAARQRIYINIPREKIDFHFKGKNTSSGWSRDTRVAMPMYDNTGQMVDLALVDDNGAKIDGVRKKFTMNQDGTLTIKDSDGVEVEIGKWSYNEDDVKASSVFSASGAGLYNHGVDLEGYGADKSRDADYLKKLADGVVEEYNNYFMVDSLVYEISDVAITFIDGDVVIYIQPLDGIKPDMADIDSDIEELSESVISAAIPMF